MKYIKTTYGLSDSTISKYANIFVLELADEFLKVRSIKDRLKYFVSLKDKNLTSDDLQEFFRLVPSFYEEYYEFLGFDGIERLNYDKEKIIKKIKRLTYIGYIGANTLSAHVRAALVESVKLLRLLVQ